MGRVLGFCISLLQQHCVRILICNSACVPDLQLCVLFFFPSFFMFVRLDFSTVDLLDILSPVSVPKQSKPAARRPETSQHRSALKTPGPVSRTLLTPARSYLHHTLEDPEESQILEDIFFICWQRRQTKTKTENRSELLDIYLFGLTFLFCTVFSWHLKPDLPWCHCLYCSSAACF